MANIQPLIYDDQKEMIDLKDNTNLQKLRARIRDEGEIWMNDTLRPFCGVCMIMEFDHKIGDLQNVKTTTQLAEGKEKIEGVTLNSDAYKAPSYFETIRVKELKNRKTGKHDGWDMTYKCKVGHNLAIMIDEVRE